MNMQTNDRVILAKRVFYNIVDEVIVENRNMFNDKSYLKLRNNKAINIDFSADNQVSLSMDIEKKYAKNADVFATKLQDEIKLMIEHITGFKINEININMVTTKA